jgi:hypothetical protein
MALNKHLETPPGERFYKSMLLLRTSIRHDPPLGNLDVVDYPQEDINDRRGSDRPHQPCSKDSTVKASEGLFDDDVQLCACGTNARANHCYMSFGKNTPLTTSVIDLADGVRSTFIERLKDLRADCHDQHCLCSRIPPMSEEHKRCSDCIRTGIQPAFTG